MLCLACASLPLIVSPAAAALTAKWKGHRRICVYTHRQLYFCVFIFHPLTLCILCQLMTWTFFVCGRPCVASGGGCIHTHIKNKHSCLLFSPSPTDVMHIVPTRDLDFFVCRRACDGCGHVFTHTHTHKEQTLLSAIFTFIHWRCAYIIQTWNLAFVCVAFARATHSVVHLGPHLGQDTLRYIRSVGTVQRFRGIYMSAYVCVRLRLSKISTFFVSVKRMEPTGTPKEGGWVCQNRCEY